PPQLRSLSLSDSPPISLPRAYISISSPTLYASTLSLHDALPICLCSMIRSRNLMYLGFHLVRSLYSRIRSRNLMYLSFHLRMNLDRKSTRLNSSHVSMSYAVFCLKKNTLPSYKSTAWACSHLG